MPSIDPLEKKLNGSRKAAVITKCLKKNAPIRNDEIPAIESLLKIQVEPAEIALKS